VSFLKRSSGGVTVVLVPEGGGYSRSFRLSSTVFRLTLVASAILVAAGLLMAAHLVALRFPGQQER
jgi:hypothetical protein